MSANPRRDRLRKGAVASALVIAGLGAGIALATTTVADAAPSATPSAASSAVDESKSVRSDEKLLTGDTAAKVKVKVKAAALAKYPGATIQRVETDSDGVYEAHIVTAAGDRVIVQVGKDFAVTGTQQGGGHNDKEDTDGD